MKMVYMEKKVLVCYRLPKEVVEFIKIECALVNQTNTDFLLSVIQQYKDSKYNNILVKSELLDLGKEVQVWKDKFSKKDYSMKPRFAHIRLKKSYYLKLRAVLKEIKSGQRQWNKEKHCWEIMNTGRWCSEKLLESRNQIIG